MFPPTTLSLLTPLSPPLLSQFPPVLFSSSSSPSSSSYPSSSDLLISLLPLDLLGHFPISGMDWLHPEHITLGNVFNLKAIIIT
ncbi:hypothetical protein E2C01_091256 [Portunus trituberculatus]|uniref:Uncharacterized protein n=1 Tax=Portunus trituberculatus TaxID=210409 RepID=A0A5B7JDH7_PORTR|nr:hypothetical protein [Portunus trituberculatus]